MSDLPERNDALASSTAMVLAAGLGKRMRPLTATRPKPLVKVAAKPLIDYTLDKLGDAGISRAVVNVSYLGDLLEDHLKGRKSPPEIVVSDERDALLETGGGLVKAQPLIAADPFFTVNSDAVWLDGPQSAFAELTEAWDPEKMDALLLLVPHQRAVNYRGRGDFHCDPNGRISRRRPGRIAPFVWTGIQLVSSRLMRDPPEGAFSTNILWDRAIAEDRLYGTVHQGLWIEVGEPGHIHAAEELLARG